MRRRQLIGLMAALAAAEAAAPAIRRLAAVDRLTWWDQAALSPNPLDDPKQGKFVAVEWRYLAGRVTRRDEDFGYIVSITDHNPLEPFVGADYQELIVMRQGLTGAQAHSTRTYRGALSYSGATYSFVPEGGSSPIASWSLDTAAQRYTLSVSTPELTLTNLLLTPQGTLIPEGGDGEVISGNIIVSDVPIQVRSDYYADWVAVSSGGTLLGLARLDMQTIRPTLGSGGGAFSHHWFCLACTLADDTPAWVTAWRIVSGASATWCVTVATGRDATWSVASTTDEQFAGAQPLSVEILDWQSIPGTSPTRRTGSRWRIQQGQAAAGDTLDLAIAVPPGQFIQNARSSTATSISMQEAVGTSASGRVGGKTITSVAFAVAESTYSERQPSPARGYDAYLPAITR